MKDSLSLSQDMMANLSECVIGYEKTLIVPVRMTGPGEFTVTAPPTVEASGEDEDSAYPESEAEPEEAGVAPGVSRMIANRGKY